MVVGLELGLRGLALSPVLVGDRAGILGRSIYRIAFANAASLSRTVSTVSVQGVLPGGLKGWSGRSASSPRVLLVMNAVSRSPSISVNRNCAPGCGFSLRMVTRIPSGRCHPDGASLLLCESV